jgi:poly(A) polymerase
VSLAVLKVSHQCESSSGSSPFSLAEQPRFRAGFDFLRLRSQVGELPEELSHWWETFSTASDTVRYDMVDEVRLEQQRAKSKPRTKAGEGKGRGAGRVYRQAADGSPLELVPGEDQPAGEPDQIDEAGEGAPAKKRRRRRRKPGGAAGSDAAGGEA